MLIRFLYLLLISSSAFAHNLYVSSKVFDDVPFITHKGSGPFDSYLGMNIEFSSVKDLFYLLDENLNGTLNKKNARTEAHITVITPVEYFKVLKDKISIEEINEIALKRGIQQAKFDIECLGRGEAMIKGKEQFTYYIVVSSKTLSDIRNDVFKVFRERGGQASQFDPELFYPHITVGYTQGDLHLGSHGVKKGKNSCYEAIHLVD